MDEAPFRGLDDIGIGLPPLTQRPDYAELVEIVERRAGLTRGAGIVSAAEKIAADPSPLGRLQTVIAILRTQIFVNAQQTLDAAAAETPAPSCRPGCGDCCYQFVGVTIPEAILAAFHIADADNCRRAAVLETADAVRGLSPRERVRTGKPCPFLALGRCSIYEDRPLMCRALLAYDHGACRAYTTSFMNGGEETEPRFSLPLWCLILGDRAAMRGICKDMGLQSDLVELTEAVATILRDPSIVSRWVAGEACFSPQTVPAV